MKAYEVIVHGRVQGVGYRIFALQYARFFQIKGYVKNLPDGNVKVIALADDESLQKFFKMLKKGPNYSWVHNLEINELHEYKNYSSFEIEY